MRPTRRPSIVTTLAALAVGTLAACGPAEVSADETVRPAGSVAVEAGGTRTAKLAVGADAAQSVRQAALEATAAAQAAQAAEEAAAAQAAEQAAVAAQAAADQAAAQAAADEMAAQAAVQAAAQAAADDAAAQAAAQAPSPGVSYDNCAAARAAGAAPVYRGDPGYASHLDRDDDGVGCES